MEWNHQVFTVTTMFGHGLDTSKFFCLTSLIRSLGILLDRSCLFGYSFFTISFNLMSYHGADLDKQLFLAKIFVFELKIK